MSDSEAQLRAADEDCDYLEELWEEYGAEFGDRMSEAWDEAAALRAAVVKEYIEAQLTQIPQPGEKCPSCSRRLPHPKKPSSPSETHPLSFGRAPADTVQELKDRVNALAEDAGLSRLPYPQARTVMLLLTLAEVVSRETLLEVASGMSWGSAVNNDS